MWLCPFVPAALAPFPRRDALQRGAAFLGHEVGEFVVSLFSTDVAVSVVFTASVEFATPKGFWSVVWLCFYLFYLFWLDSRHVLMSLSLEPLKIFTYFYV